MVVGMTAALTVSRNVIQVKHTPYVKGHTFSALDYAQIAAGVGVLLYFNNLGTHSLLLFVVGQSHQIAAIIV